MRWSLIALLSLLVCGCSSDDNLSMAIDVDPEEWREAAKFSIDNTDVLSLRDVSLFVRYQPMRERVDSLPLHVVTIAPDGVRAVEQFTFYYRHKGGDQWERRLYREAIFRRKVRFSQRGEYQMLIYPQGHAYGVETIGIAIKRE